jgi:hypothetical protein
MNILKFSKALAASAVLSMALLGAPAQAAVDFESDFIVIPTLVGNTLLSGEYSFSSGTPIGIVDGNTYPGAVVNNGSTNKMLVFVSNPSSGELTVQRSDNGLFSLSSLDVGGYWGASHNAMFSVTGHPLLGTLITVSTALSQSSFAQLLTPSFTNLTSLTMRISGFPPGVLSGTPAYVAIDNLVLTPVPEPETYALLLAGLGLLVVAARRRKTLG